MTLASTSLETDGWALMARRFRALLAAAVLLVANCAVQAHIHGAPLNQAVSHAVSLSSPHGAPADQEDACPLCQAAAISGAFLLPALLAITTPGAFAWRTQAPVSHLPSGIPAVGWTARGPPRR
ncbi:MAG TPA: hypothetical protein VGC16_06910 [Rhizomicrobium sp.]